MAGQDDNREHSASTDVSNPTRALHRDWLSVIMSGLEKGIQLSLNHDIDNSRARLSTLNELVKAAHLSRMVS